MRIMYVSRNFPYPPNSGERQRDFQLIKALSLRHDVTLVSRMYSEEDALYHEEASEFCSKVLARLIPKSASKLEAVRRIAGPLIRGEPSQLGTTCFHSIGKMISAELQKEPYDVVQFEHTALAFYRRYIPDSFAGALTIDLHNVETIRLRRLCDLAPYGLGKLLLWRDANAMRRFEPRALGQFDHIFTVSDLERDAVLEMVPGKRVTTVANGADFSRKLRSSETGASRRPGELLYVGSLRYAANEDAVLWFAQRVLPRIKEEMECVHFTVVGHNPTARVRACASEHIEVTGSVADVSPYYERASLCVVPLRAGGGSRLKILEAAKFGVPIVTTKVGAEGLDLRPNIDVAIADCENLFAENVVRLLRDVEAQNQMAESARSRVEVLYDWERIGAGYVSAIEDTVLNAPFCRNRST